MAQIHHDFNPTGVDLNNRNLIEASAGTGKTFSIALMTVRLLLEEKALGRILMVTFTKAAVAELELRVRVFIRTAIRYVRIGVPGDDPIGEVVAPWCQDPVRRKAAQDLLSRAEIEMDDLSVMTIHSFCQKVIREHSFETGQVFGADTLSPESYGQMVDDAFNEFWRSKVAVLDASLLSWLLGAGLSWNKVNAMVREGLSGKLPARVGAQREDMLSTAHQQELVQALDDQRASAICDRVLPLMEQDAAGILDRTRKDKNATKAYEAHIVALDWAALFDVVAAKPDVGYATKVFGAAIIDQVREFNSINAEQLQLVFELINQITCAAFDYVRTTVEEEKLRQGVITFDDMIVKVAAALIPDEGDESAEGDELRKRLLEQYDAIFIDEFQDTDKDQYKIFGHVFGKGDKVLFYIGDPKQSIYGWRKADIFTYFKARQDVDHVHEMNINRRSNEFYINAMNQFFAPRESTDTFAFGTGDAAVKYHPVASPPNNKQGVLEYDGSPVVPIRISPCDNKRELARSFQKAINDLLRDKKYKIRKGGELRDVVPSDIGILVRTNKEGKAIKDMLSRIRIPAVTIDDSKLFGSSEATELYHVMVAVHEVSRSHINRALLTRIGGYDREKLLKADEDANLERFRKYQETWNTVGVYVMLRQFMADHGIEDLFSNPDLPSPERTVSNYLQLTEIIHRISESRNYTPADQIQWLKKGIDGEIRDGDEYEQRIESDDKAVKIVTIHKSKGLEYNIVLAPHLDLTTKNNYDTVSYRDPGESRYYVVEKRLATEEQRGWAEEQLKQENRRLLYVAITRARFACFILANEASYYKGSALHYFREEMREAGVNPSLVDLNWTIGAGARFAIDAALMPPPVVREYAKADAFRDNIRQEKWRRTSYTGLSPEHEVLPMPRTGLFATEYDRFIFQTLRKGAQTGNLLHYIFERIDFSKEDHWSSIVGKALRRISAGDTPVDFEANLSMLIGQVVHTELPVDGGFNLSDVPWKDRLSELEFDFPLGMFDSGKLAALSTGTEAPFFVRSTGELEGLMNGKIDLVFRYKGKYYILDWKSNYLGDQLTDYSLARVQDAMTHNNYHLQHHIYTVALRKYLETRIPGLDFDAVFGGCIYLFVRGMRIGVGHGIHFHKPDPAIVQRMLSLMDPVQV